MEDRANTAVNVFVLIFYVEDNRRLRAIVAAELENWRVGGSHDRWAREARYSRSAVLNFKSEVGACGGGDLEAA